MCENPYHGTEHGQMAPGCEDCGETWWNNGTEKGGIHQAPFHELANRIVSAEDAGIAPDIMMPPHGEPGHICSADFMYEMRFSGRQLQHIHTALHLHFEALRAGGQLAILAGDATEDDVVSALKTVADMANGIADTVQPRIKAQLAAEARWEEFHIGNRKPD